MLLGFYLSILLLHGSSFIRFFYGISREIAGAGLGWMNQEGGGRSGMGSHLVHGPSVDDLMLDVLVGGLEHLDYFSICWK